MTHERPALPDAKLVRVAAVDGTWIDRLPPVPGGWTCTVTAGAPELAEVPTDELVAGGYRLAGVLAADERGGGFVDVLVPDALSRSHPSWWRAITEVAERTFSLAHGPVARLFSDVLALHASALDRP